MNKNAKTFICKQQGAIRTDSIARLTFNDQICKIGNFNDKALNQFKSLEKRLSKNDSLKQGFDDFLRDYRDLDHTRDIAETDDQNEGYYIYHIIRSTNVLLNDALLVGSTIQDDLIFIIMRFRIHNIVLAADM